MPAVSFAWYFVPLCFLLLFFIVYKKINRAKLAAGVMLSCALISFGGIFCLHAYLSENLALRFFLALILLSVLFIFTAGVYVFIGFLILNTRAVLKKDSRSLKHCLSLILAAGLLLLLIFSRAVDLTALPPSIQSFIYAVYGLVIFYFIHLAQFIISASLCNFSRPRKDQDYIIVLGCWAGGEGEKIPPLLARRVDRAIKFYSSQKKMREPPRLVLSGGRGEDEPRSEAEAMRAYALEKGIPEEHLLLEDRSASTFENIKFSKELMDADSGGKPYKCIYTTNNYHVLRAGIFAGRAGLQINGIGAKTAIYYLPNAVLREYIAYLYIYLKWHFAFGIFCLIAGSFISRALIDFLSQLSTKI